MAILPGQKQGRASVLWPEGGALVSLFLVECPAWSLSGRCNANSGSDASSFMVDGHGHDYTDYTYPPTPAHFLRYFKLLFLKGRNVTVEAAEAH